MRISLAGMRSGHPITRFAAVPSSRRESYLGLRRRPAPQITAHPATSGEVPLVAALRPQGLRAESAPAPGRDAGTAARPVLRRANSITWSRPGSGAASRPRLRSTAPWRG